MKNAIIIHGKPDKDEYYNNTVGSPSNMHWLPWLQHQLVIKDILAQTPEMPRPYQPVYEDWLAVFKQFQVSDQTILVGHSCGGGFLLRFLSENDTRVGRVILVAPSLGLDWDDRSMMEFVIKPSIVSQTAGVTILVANNDRDSIREAVAQMEREIKDVKVRRLDQGGHLTYKDMQTTEFPELLHEVMA